MSFSNEYYKDITITPPSINGYTAIGVCGFYVKAAQYYPISISLNTIYIVHSGGDNVTNDVPVDVTFLYIKNLT